MKKYLKTRMDVSGSSNQSQSTNDTPQENTEGDRRVTSPRENWIMLHIPCKPECPGSPPDEVNLKEEVIDPDYVENEQPDLENTIFKEERSTSPEIPHRGIHPPLPPQPPLPDSPELKEPNGTSPKFCGEFITGTCKKEMCQLEHRSDLAQLVKLGWFSTPLTRQIPPPPSSPDDKYKEKTQKAPEYPMENQSPYFDFFHGPYSTDLSDVAHQPGRISQPPPPPEMYSPPPQTSQPPSPDRFHTPAPQISEPFRRPQRQANVTPQPNRFRIPPPQIYQSFHQETFYFRYRHEPPRHYRRDRFQYRPLHTYETSRQFQRDRFRSRSSRIYEPPTSFQRDSFHTPPSPSSSAFFSPPLDTGHPQHPPFYPVSYTPSRMDSPNVIATEIEEILFQLEIENRSKMEEAGRDQVCKDFIRGSCNRNHCRFLHNRFINKKIDRSQIFNFCWDFQNGVCYSYRNRICNYLHATKFEEEDFYRTGKLPVHVMLQRRQAPALLPRTSAPLDPTSISNNSRPASSSQVSSDEKPTCEESDSTVNPNDAVIDAMVTSLTEKIKTEWKRINLLSTPKPDLGAEGPAPRKRRRSV